MARRAAKVLKQAFEAYGSSYQKSNQTAGKITSKKGLFMTKLSKFITCFLLSISQLCPILAMQQVDQTDSSSSSDTIKVQKWDNSLVRLISKNVETFTHASGLAVVIYGDTGQAFIGKVNKHNTSEEEPFLTTSSGNIGEESTNWLLEVLKPYGQIITRIFFPDSKLIDQTIFRKENFPNSTFCFSWRYKPEGLSMSPKNCQWLMKPDDKGVHILRQPFSPFHKYVEENDQLGTACTAFMPREVFAVLLEVCQSPLCPKPGSIIFKNCNFDPKDNWDGCWDKFPTHNVKSLNFTGASLTTEIAAIIIGECKNLKDLTIGLQCNINFIRDATSTPAEKLLTSKLINAFPLSLDSLFAGYSPKASYQQQDLIEQAIKNIRPNCKVSSESPSDFIIGGYSD